MNSNAVFRLALIVLCSGCFYSPTQAQTGTKVRNRDRKKDLLLVTTEGNLKIRLTDATPLHRDNFLRLVKSGYYNDISFHRVIRGFMVQAGNLRTKQDSAQARDTLRYPTQTIPAEFRPELFHKRGALAAARLGDQVNPAKASSAYQFYIVQGKTFTDASLDSVETFRLSGRKIPQAHRDVYRSVGGAPHLDQNYTVFGEVIEGMDLVDRIASRPTTGPAGADKPLKDIRIKELRMVRRKKNSP